MNPREETLDEFHEWIESVGRTFQFPPTPAVASQIVARLQVEPTPRRPARIFGFLAKGQNARFLRASVAALVIVALALGLATAVSPTVRAAVKDVLGLKRIEVVRVGQLPPTPESGATFEAVAGRITLADAERSAGFYVAVPDYPEGLGEPDEVYVQDLESGKQVVLVYRVKPGVEPPPDGGDTLFTLFQFKIKGLFRKFIAPATRAEQFSVSGAETLWLEGTSHTLQYLDPDGGIRAELERTVIGNTLAWEIGDVTYRLETSLSREEAIKVAGSLR